MEIARLSYFIGPEQKGHVIHATIKAHREGIVIKQFDGPLFHSESSLQVPKGIGIIRRSITSLVHATLRQMPSSHATFFTASSSAEPTGQKYIVTNVRYTRKAAQAARTGIMPIPIEINTILPVATELVV
jgi:hypothetical protein